MAPAVGSRLTDQQLQAIAQALADPRRFAILQQIARQQSLLCSALCERNVLAPATISYHLKVLTEAGLLDIAREGRLARLTLRRDTWTTYLHQLAEL